MDSVYCTECGAKNNSNELYCKECGAPLDREFLTDEESTSPGGNAPSSSNQTSFQGQSERQSTSLSATTPSKEKNSGTEKSFALIVASVVGVLAVGFAIFYFANPLSPATTTLENSAAAQVAVEQTEAETSDAELLEETQAQLEEAQQRADEAEDAQKEAEQQAENAQRAAEETNEVFETDEVSEESPAEPSSVASITVTGEDGDTRTAVAQLVGDTERVIPDSNTRPLTESEVASLTDGERYIAWKEIIAAETGYMFVNKALSQYFMSRSWYTPNPEGNGYCEPGVAADNVNKLKNSLDDTWWLHITYP